MHTRIVVYNDKTQEQVETIFEFGNKSIEKYPLAFINMLREITERYRDFVIVIENF